MSAMAVESSRSTRQVTGLKLVVHGISACLMCSIVRHACGLFDLCVVYCLCVDLRYRPCVGHVSCLYSCGLCRGRVTSSSKEAMLNVQVMISYTDNVPYLPTEVALLPVQEIFLVCQLGRARSGGRAVRARDYPRWGVQNLGISYPIFSCFFPLNRTRQGPIWRQSVS